VRAVQGGGGCGIAADGQRDAQGRKCGYASLDATGVRQQGPHGARAEDPGRPYQRGTNEITNGLARHFFPKGTDFNTVTHWEVRQVENVLNHRPRACLSYRTPYEAFHGVHTPLRCD
jgi:hypothetical protein